MAESIATFFQIIGENITAPVTMSELIPYLLTVFVGLVLVISVFRTFAVVVRAVIELTKKV